MSGLQNPRKWRYTWETLAHIPTLRLFIFNPDVAPANQCRDLKVSLNLEQSLVLVNWSEENRRNSLGSVDFSLRVPLPRVLIDHGSPLDFKAREDHIEVKLVLLLPIDHPLAANFDSVVSSSDKSSPHENLVSDRWRLLSADIDMKCLSSSGGVDLYCKNCSVKLTRRPLRSFVEMPSANWREVADNWFGACCCSFGGISEKLVINYASHYFCKEGTCLLDAAVVILSKDDLAEYLSRDCFDKRIEHTDGYDLSDGSSATIEAARDSCGNGRHGLHGGYEIDGTSDISQILDTKPLEEENFGLNVKAAATNEGSNFDSSICTSPMIELPENEVPSFGDLDGDCGNIKSGPWQVHNCCSHDTSIISSNDQMSMQSMKLVRSQKSLLNGFLGNGFMIRTSNLSKDVNWNEFRCTHCSALLGAYPSDDNGNAPMDGGVRFFKCNTSTSLPIGELDDIFRKYTLQGMFVNQLLETTKDELSFRTLVRDVKSRSPLLKIVLLNSEGWCSSGICLEADGTMESFSKMDLQPIVKVLFSDCRDSTEDQRRMIEEWATKNQADEIYMLACQVELLIDSLKSAHNRFPLSCSFMQGLWLSYIER